MAGITAKGGQRRSHARLVKLAADDICYGAAKPPGFAMPQEIPMNEDVLNTSVRKFLKKVGVTSQREIEQAVRAAVAAGRLKGSEPLPAKATISIPALGLNVEIDAAVELE